MDYETAEASIMQLHDDLYDKYSGSLYLSSDWWYNEFNRMILNDYTVQEAYEQMVILACQVGDELECEFNESD